MINESVKELKVLSVSRCTQDGGVYMAILKERRGERIMPVLVERSDAFQLLMKMKGVKPTSLPSSMSDIMKSVFMPVRG